MSDPFALVAAMAAGAALGALFYGGLWWTVHRGLTSERAAFWFIASLPLRVVIALLGIYLVSGGNWKRMLLCLLGFLIARLVVTWLARTAVPYPAPQAAENTHAP